MEVKNVDPKLQTYLSARNLSMVKKMGFDTVIAPCNGCYHNLKKAEYDLANDANSREVTDRLSRKAGHETYEAGKVETIHGLDWIKQAIVRGGPESTREELAQGPQDRQLLSTLPNSLVEQL
jgi:heterodisulfide reductase subunit B2